MAEPSRFRKFRREDGGPNAQSQQGAVAVRHHARYLQQNHDLTRGTIRTLVNNIVGPNGIGIEPQPRRKGDGSIHKEYAKALLEAFRHWQHRPEVTYQYHWGRVQRMLCGTWVRDGEAFAQRILGPVPGLIHSSSVPLSLELFEPDMIPYYLTDQQKNIIQGIEVNEWGRPVAYWAHKQHPHETKFIANTHDLRRIPADRILHIASCDRIGQLRGVSEFSSIISRIEDIKDYEESERVAAKIAAMLTAYVKKGTPEMYEPDGVQVAEDGSLQAREIRLQTGMIIDDLAIGEEIGMIDSKRPNAHLVAFRQGQLRAAASGIGVSYSSMAKDYSGTFSSQRQELVEQWINYATLTDEFTGNVIQPVWEAFVRAADLSGAVPIPNDVIDGTEDDALFLGQSMPWIDPMKEATAWLTLVRGGFASETEVIRKRGGNPDSVLEQMAEWREQVSKRGIVLSSDAGYKDGKSLSDPGEDLERE